MIARLFTSHKSLGFVTRWPKSKRSVVGWLIGFGDRSMTTLQAIAFGAMLAWTPGLIILAVSLWDVRDLDGME